MYTGRSRLREHKLELLGKLGFRPSEARSAVRAREAGVMLGAPKLAPWGHLRSPWGYPKHRLWSIAGCCLDRLDS